MIFPPIISHNSGTRLKLDDTLFLLGFREPISRTEVQPLLEQTSVRLEELILTQEQNGVQIKRKVNHTNRLYWVHSEDGTSLSENDLESIRHTLATELEWVGPVLRFPAAEVNLKGHPVCALPHVLIIKPTTEAIIGDLDHALVPLGLRYQADISQYLNGLRLYYVASFSNNHVLPPTAAHDLQMTLRDKKYENLVAATYLDYMPMFVPTASPRDPEYVNQWNLQKIEAEEGWRYAKWNIDTDPFPAGDGVRVAIIDDGVQLDHPDLINGINTSLATTFSTPPSPPVKGPGPPAGGSAQGDSHGTYCASVLAARCNNKDAAGRYIGMTGLAGACEILPLRLDGYIVSTFIAAINYAAFENCHIISYSATAQELQDPNVRIAISTAFEQGVIICAASGNDDEPVVGYPAAYKDYVIACGATDINDNRCKDGTAGWPPGYGSNYGGALSVVAPGVNITACTLNSGYVNDFWGTSAATPQVAALAALIMSSNPLLKRQPRIVRSLIESGALKAGTGSWNSETGYGRINVLESIRKAFRVSRAMLLAGSREVTTIGIAARRKKLLRLRKIVVRKPPKFSRPPKTPPGPKMDKRGQ